MKTATAQEDVEHVCGHTTTYQVWGNRARREIVCDRLGARKCPTCLRTERVEADKALAARLRTEQAERGEQLPALTGTEKQVAFAGDIRAKAIAYIDKAREEAEADALHRGHAPESRRDYALAPLYRTAVSAITDAAWWCDRGYVSSESTMHAALGQWLRGSPLDSGDPNAIEAVASAVARTIVEQRLLRLLDAEPASGASSFERDFAPDIQRVMVTIVGEMISAMRGAITPKQRRRLAFEGLEPDPTRRMIAAAWPGIRAAFLRAAMELGYDLTISPEVSA